MSSPVIPLEIQRYLLGPLFDQSHFVPADTSPTHHAFIHFPGEGPTPPELRAELSGLTRHIEQYLLDHPNLIPIPFLFTYRNIPPTPPRADPPTSEQGSTNPPSPPPPAPPVTFNWAAAGMKPPGADAGKKTCGTCGVQTDASKPECEVCEAAI